MLIHIINFLDVSRKRGPSVPNAVRSDFGIFTSILGIEWPLTYPGVYVASLKPKLVKEGQAPLPPYEFVLALEKAADSTKENPGIRLFAALFSLMTFASLRYCDALDVQYLWKTSTAICGISINHKDSGGSTHELGHTEVGGRIERSVVSNNRPILE